MMKGLEFMRRVFRSQFITYAVIVMAAYCIQSCKKSAVDGNSVDCNGTMKSFASDVKPVVQASCAFDSDCHGNGSTSGPGSLLTYSQIFEARSAIRNAVFSGEMPKGASLTASEKNAVICWIDNGAQNN